jgi:hypothetical protein
MTLTQITQSMVLKTNSPLSKRSIGIKQPAISFGRQQTQVNPRFGMDAATGLFDAFWFASWFGGMTPEDKRKWSINHTLRMYRFDLIAHLKKAQGTSMSLFAHPRLILAAMHPHLTVQISRYSTLQVKEELAKEIKHLQQTGELPKASPTKEALSHLSLIFFNDNDTSLNMNINIASVVGSLLLKGKLLLLAIPTLGASLLILALTAPLTLPALFLGARNLLEGLKNRKHDQG